jgi:hypothetical protein
MKYKSSFQVALTKKMANFTFLTSDWNQRCPSFTK